MLLKYFIKLFYCSLIFNCTISFAQTDKNNLSVTPSATAAAFPLFSNNGTPTFYYDAADAKVVAIAAHAFAGDIELLSGKKMTLSTDNRISGPYTIIAGTIGHSYLIDQLIKSKKIKVDSIQNKWETFSISIIDNPFATGGTIGGKAMGVMTKALVIAGSDRRGTAFGIFHLSRTMGIAPFVWWADVVPEKKEQLFISGNYIAQEPSVKYRGIFINDEDWGFYPWAKKTMDTDVKNIGPKAYIKVFELLLRLKANYIWPAMHDSTKAFYYYKQSPKIADDYAIVIGGSHCEPMLRNNVCEWEQTFVEEYKKQHGEWRYDVNKNEIYNYWNDRIKQAVNYESVFTIGMRGVHDGSMPGPKNVDEKVKLLEQVISDQRQILENNFKEPVTKLPQIFIPYKEVLSLYRRGMKLPDDITIIWPDENFGYIRQLSNTEEQKRSGGSGVYYHLSYLGGPHDYTWLCSTAPPLIAYEMTKAYQFGADRLWIVNVGDIKPAEMETQFFLDMAWNISKWTPENAQQYTQYWAEENFGKDLASKIADIKNDYYKLVQEGKPEHMRMLKFTNDAMKKRLINCAMLMAKVNKVKEQIPATSISAFFELIEYPVKATVLMNQKILNARMSFEMPSDAKEFSQQSKQAFDEIKRMTTYYNHDLENGKWNSIVSYMPRNLAVYGMPEVAVPQAATDTAVKYDRRYLDRSIDSFGIETGKPSLNSRFAVDYKTKNEITGEKIITVKGLGAGGFSISRYPFTGISFKKEEWSKAPYVEYEFSQTAGNYNLVLKCLPTHAINKDRSLKLAVTVNNSEPVLLDIDNPEENKKWETDILKGYTEVIVPLNITQDKTIVRVYLLDTGLALSKIEIQDK